MLCSSICLRNCFSSSSMISFAGINFSITRYKLEYEPPLVFEEDNTMVADNLLTIIRLLLATYHWICQERIFNSSVTYALMLTILPANEILHTLNHIHSLPQLFQEWLLHFVTYVLRTEVMSIQFLTWFGVECWDCVSEAEDSSKLGQVTRETTRLWPIQ